MVGEENDAHESLKVDDLYALRIDTIDTAIQDKVVAYLKLSLRNCGDLVNGFMQIISKREHFQIA